MSKGAYLSNWPLLSVTLAHIAQPCCIWLPLLIRCWIGLGSCAWSLLAQAKHRAGCSVARHLLQTVADNPSHCWGTVMVPETQPSSAGAGISAVKDKHTTRISGCAAISSSTDTHIGPSSARCGVLLPWDLIMHYAAMAYVVLIVSAAEQNPTCIH
jgi:hypothetical protein